MMTHTNAFPEGGKISYGETSNGMVGKSIKFSGKASYVGRERHIGINALNAAMIALSGIHAQRETYRDQDTIRIQPILTSGGAVGSSVSSSDVRMETYVCGSSIDAFLSASEKVDKALRAGAMAVGGSVTISTLPGSLPIKNDQLLIDIYSANAVSLVGRSDLTRRSHDTESTDMGDVSQLMPVIHPYVNAGTGVLHGDDYLIDDYELGVLTGAKAMAMTTIDLLSEGGVKGVGVVNNYHASLTKQEYLALLRKILKKETYTE
jgi:metal-dependent amidase/aminoacylase/carboxypeptidase family protein